jgi:hypothetical protein
MMWGYLIARPFALVVYASILFLGCDSPQSSDVLKTEDELEAQAYVKYHPDSNHSSAHDLLDYLKRNNTPVTTENLGKASNDLASGTNSFKEQPASFAPSPPVGTYFPISVLSSGKEHDFLSNTCVATFVWFGTDYTVERDSIFGCDVLLTDNFYFARWGSDGHKEFVIGSLKPSVAAGQKWPETVR